MNPARPEILPCPLCPAHGRPEIVRGGHSGKFFARGEVECAGHLAAAMGFAGGDYSGAPATEAEARERWNAWALGRTAPSVAAGPAFCLDGPRPPA